MKLILAALILISVCTVTAYAGNMLLFVGGSGNGGSGTTNFLLANTGSVILVNTGSKMLVR